MKTLRVISAVVARDTVVVRASVRLAGVVGAGKVTIVKDETKSEYPWEVKVLGGVSKLVEDMADEGISGAVVVSNRIYPRVLQALKVVGGPKAINKMMLPWMEKDGMGDFWKETLNNLLNSLRSAKKKGVVVNFIKVTNLYHIDILPVTDNQGKVAGGTIGTFKKGLCEELNLYAPWNKLFSGSVKLYYDHKDNLYGDIIVSSLAEGAADFLNSGRAAVDAAMGELPKVTVNEVALMTDKF